MDHSPRSQQENQCQYPINGIVTISYHTNWTHRQSQCRNQSGHHSKVTTHQHIQEDYRQHTTESLWKKDAKRCKAKDLRAERLQPEANRWLINSDKTAWIKRHKK